MRRHRRVSLSLLLVAFVALLWRAPLPPLTVAAFPGAIVIIDAHRQAICLGDCSGKSLARFLSYNGVKPGPGKANNFKVRASGVWTTVESASPPASILVGSPGLRWQPPDTIPPRLAALVILREDEQAARNRSASDLYGAAWDFARENHADWLVFDSTSGGRSRRLGRWREPRATPNLPSVAFLGGHPFVLTSGNDDPARLRPDKQ